MFKTNHNEIIKIGKSFSLNDGICILCDALCTANSLLAMREDALAGILYKLS